VALGLLVFAGCCTVSPAGPEAWSGTWSAPSLSRPDTPIIITLKPDGRATEQIGTYRGTGDWGGEAGVVRINWASGWRGVLRKSAGDGFELRTWKAGSPLDGPPDDVQAAQRRP
jgi:hypothetical protein